jgi:hypothetical protein
MYDDKESEEIKNLILDGVIEGTSPETTGKFGTGFMTTYMLSRIVEISGVYINVEDAKLHHNFTLKMDRSSRIK